MLNHVKYNLLFVKEPIILYQLVILTFSNFIYFKDFKNQCVDDETGSTHRLHSSWQMKNECGQKTCVKYSNLLYIQYETCGLTDVSLEIYVRSHTYLNGN